MIDASGSPWARSPAKVEEEIAASPSAARARAGQDTVGSRCRQGEDSCTLASVPTARMALLFVLMATTDASSSTTARPRT